MATKTLRKARLTDAADRYKRFVTMACVSNKLKPFDQTFKEVTGSAKRDNATRKR
jgi:hypothetical protein